MNNLKNIINNIEVARGNQEGFTASIPLKLILTTELNLKLDIKADSLEEAEMSIASIIEDLKERIRVQHIKENGFDIIELNTYFANLDGLEKILNSLCAHRVNKQDFCI